MVIENIEERVMSVDEFEDGAVQWLVPHWIPKGAITLLCGDGDTGKTTFWCHLLAGISSRRWTLLDGELNKDDGSQFPLENSVCMYFSAEDPTSQVIKRNLNRFGANIYRIHTLSMSDTNLLTYDSKALEEMIASQRPAICVFDPVQAFYPDRANFTSRKDTRKALSYLASLGEKYGTAFLLVCHTNKNKKGDWKADLAGSPDMPDYARSVIYLGKTNLAENGRIRFISNEKNNYYAGKETTVLYSMKDGRLIPEGLSGKRYEDYFGTLWIDPSTIVKSGKDQCKDAIMEILSNCGEMKMSDLDRSLNDAGFTRKPSATAKAELEAEGRIVRWCAAENKRAVWRVKLAE